MFLTLPLELRLQIYSYLLHLPPPTPLSSPTIHAPILLTNHLIHAEATPLLYAENTFIAHPSMLTSFPRLRSYYPPIRCAEPVRLIRRYHLTVRLDCDLPFTKEAATEAFSGIEALELYLVQSVFLGVGGTNLRAFEGVRGVGRVVITGSTTGIEGYVEWLRGVMQSERGVDVKEFERSEEEDDIAVRLNVHI